jgi:Ice-binding-like
MAQLLSTSRRSSRTRVMPFKRAVFVVLAAGAVLFASSSLAAAATAPSLGAAGSYSVLAGTTVTNTGSTTMPGDLGVSPGSAVTGFPPGIVGPPGTIHNADSNAAAAQAANTAAFGVLDQVCTVTYPGNKDLVGLSLVPGVYCADAFTLTGTLTLSGTGVWIFKSAATLITSGTANVVGGDPCNVWWRLVSSAVLGTNTSLVGNILASTSISLATGATLNGRAFAHTGGVTLENNAISGCSAASPTSSTKLTYTGTTTAAPGASITLRATLKTSAGLAIAGKTVTFTLHGVTASAKTNSSGVASVVTKAPTGLGAYAIKIVFKGDTTHPAASTSATLSVREATAAPTPPATDTLATTDVPRSGPTPVIVLVGIFLFAFVVLAAVVGRRTMRRAAPTDPRSPERDR